MFMWLDVLAEWCKDRYLYICTVMLCAFMPHCKYDSSCDHVVKQHTMVETSQYLLYSEDHRAFHVTLHQLSDRQEVHR